MTTVDGVGSPAHPESAAHSRVAQRGNSNKQNDNMKLKLFLLLVVLGTTLAAACGSEAERQEKIIRQIGRLEGRYDFDNRTWESTEAFVSELLSTVREFPVPDSLIEEINGKVRLPIHLSEAQVHFVRECMRMAAEPDTEKVNAFVRDNRKQLYRIFLNTLSMLTRKTAADLQAPAALDTTAQALPWISRSLDALHGGDFFSTSLAELRRQTRADAERRATMNACVSISYKDMNSPEKEKALAGIAYGLRQGDLQREPRNYLNLLSNLQFVLYEKFGRQEASVTCGEFIMRHTARIDYWRLYAKAQYFCGSAFIDKGAFRQALEQERQAIPILNRYGYESEARNAHERMNVVYRHLGRYQQALSQLELSLPQDGQRPRTESLMRYHNGRGVLFKDLGRYDEARWEFAKAVETAKMANDPANVSVSLANSGDLYSELANYDSALVYFQQALNVRHGTPFVRSSNLQGLIGAYTGLGYTDSAKVNSKRLATLLSNSRSSTKIAQQSYSAAELQLKINEVDAAYISLQKALSSYQAMGDVHGEFDVLCKMAGVEMRRGQNATAQDFVEEALQLAAEYPGIDKTWPAYFALAQTYVHSGDNVKAEEALEKATGNIEKVGSSVNTYQQRASFSDRIRPVYEQMVSVKLALGDTLAAFGYSEKERAQALRHKLEETRETHSRNTLLSSTGPDSSTRAKTQTLPTFQQIGTSLDENACLIEYEILDSSVVVWLVGRHGVETRVVAAPRDEIAETVAAFRRHLEPQHLRGIDDIRKSDSEIRSLGRELYGYLLRPLRTLERYKTLIVVADEMLNDLPFAALVQDNDAFLVEKYCIAQEPSAAILMEMLNRTQTRVLASGRTSVVCVVHPQLKYGRKEARAVARMCTKSDILLGSAIRKEALFRVIQSGPDALLFSTHGMIDARFPGNSHLAFSQQTTPPEAGQISLPEIQALHLQATDLVYLSACESATGRRYRGEGTMSLQLSFITAGAKSVVANLWQVDDRTSMKLTTKFFHGWIKSGLPKLQALRQAQLALIKSVREKGLYPPHPYFWAPITLTGFPG